MQKRSSPTTRYEPHIRPSEKDGYVQRIPMWDVIKRLGSANRSELYRELQRIGYSRPMGAKMDESYCRVELTDMTRRGFLRRVKD